MAIWVGIGLGILVGIAMFCHKNDDNDNDDFNEGCRAAIIMDSLWRFH